MSETSERTPTELEDLRDLRVACEGWRRDYSAWKAAKMDRRLLPQVLAREREIRSALDRCTMHEALRAGERRKEHADA